MKREHIYITVILGLLLSIVIISIDASHQLKKYTNLTPRTITKIQYRDHYLTDVQVKEHEIIRTDTIYIPSDSIYIYAADTVFAPVPISRFVLDTITPDSCRISAVLTGFHVALDSLSIQTRDTASTTVIYEPERKWHFGYGFAVGLGWVK